MGGSVTNGSQADEFLTVAGTGGGETKVKGSRFIVAVAAVGSEQAADDFIRRVARQRHDATHNCYAFRVGLGGRAVARHSDAGEPPGTAGRPILEAITSRGLTDVAVVVTRYFGGTKLGTGGLARAYRECALRGLEAAGTRKRYRTVRVAVTFPYDLTGDMRRILKKHRARVLEGSYDQQSRLVVAVRLSERRGFMEEVTLAGKGQVRIRTLAERT
jgi:uncharacterized YigZ family protein